MQKLNYMLLLVFFVIVSSCIFADETIRRACFDIGSGSTKMVVADVNVNKNIVNVIYEESEAVAYKQDLDKSKNKKFSLDIQNQGLLMLAKMKEVALEKGAKQFAGVATEAFREALNGQEFADNITRRLGIYVTIITQREEAMIGFAAGIAGEEKKLEEIVVWDIGGGSMQIVSQEAAEKYEFYFGKVASKSLANYIVKNIQGKDLSKVNSPNPISEDDSMKALQYVQEEANKVSEVLKNKIKNPNTLIIGVGGVHYYSVRNQVNMGKEFTLEGVSKTLNAQLNKTDSQIGGQFADTEVGNLILVKGFMETLGINKVKAKKVNNAHGILLLQKFWK